MTTRTPAMNANVKRIVSIAWNASVLREFVGVNQRKVISSAMRGEEGQWFFGKMAELETLVNSMPKSYEQDGKGDEAIVSLHYFTASADWYITERDIDEDHAGQVQAFGLADLFHDGGELGYISIVDLLVHGAELDLHFKPRTLAEVRASRKL
jgi:hypothetical protein